MIRLETARLVLRTLTPRDAELLLDFDTRNRAWLAPWEPQRDHSYFTAQRCAASIRADALAARRRTGYRWHLFRKEQPRRILGSVSLSNIVRGVFLSTHLGYRLDGEETGHGFMGEAVDRIVRHAFDDLGLHRVEANVMPRNAASRRLLLRLGFAEEGLARQYLRIAGVWEDHIRHTRLAGGPP